MSEDLRRTQPFCTPRCFRECQCTRWPDMVDRWGNPVNHGSGGATEELFDLHVDWLNGNDANTGGIADPLQTIAHALTHVGANQKIGLHGDSANLATYFREDGLVCAVNGVTIKAVAGNTPVIVATDELTVWAKTGGRVNVYESVYAGIAQTGAANGATVLEPVANVAACDAAPNSFYMDEVASILYVNIGGGAPTSIEAADAVDWIVTTSGNNITIDGVICQWNYPSYLLSGTADVIQNCTSRYQLRERTATHLMIRVSGHDAQLLDTVMNYAPSTLSGAYIVQVSAALADDCLIDGCTLTGCNNPAIKVDGGAGHEIRNCTFDDNKDPLMVSGTADVDFHHNLVVDWTQYGVYLDWDVVGTINIYKNSFYLEHAAGPKIGMLLWPGCTINVYHNVFYRLDHSGSNNGIGIQTQPLVAGQVLTVKNNAFFSFRYGIQWVGAIEPTWDLDYNGFHDMATANYLDVHVADQGTHDNTDEPLFTDAPNYDFTLDPASTYIGGGVFVPGISEQNPATIGRYEYP